MKTKSKEVGLPFLRSIKGTTFETNYDLRTSSALVVEQNKTTQKQQSKIETW